jgi:predicted P-loop ATPase
MNWHKDDSGGRRYWPIECKHEIDTQWLKDNRDQLFAEAKALYEDGGSWHDVPVAEQRERLAAHHTIDPWQDKIRDWLTSTELWTGWQCDVIKQFPDPLENEASKHWGTMITTSRVLTECIQMPMERQNKAAANKVSLILRGMGFEYRSIRGDANRKMKAWVVPHLSETEGSQKALGLSELEP